MSLNSSLKKPNFKNLFCFTHPTAIQKFLSSEKDCHQKERKQTQNSLFSLFYRTTVYHCYKSLSTIITSQSLLKTVVSSCLDQFDFPLKITLLKIETTDRTLARQSFDMPKPNGKVDRLDGLLISRTFWLNFVSYSF